jgi:hypothetical protein
MASLGLQGVILGKPVRTTVSKADCRRRPGSQLTCSPKQPAATQSSLPAALIVGQAHGDELASR